MSKQERIVAYIGPSNDETRLILLTEGNEIISVEITSGRDSILIEGKDCVMSATRCLVGWCSRSFNERLNDDPPDTEPDPESRDIA